MCSMSWADHNCLYKLLNVLKDRVFICQEELFQLKICSNGLLKDKPVIVRFHCAGDNNLRDGRGLYAHGQMWLQRHHIMGRSVGYISQLLPTFQCFSVFVSSHIWKLSWHLQIFTISWVGDNYHDREALYQGKLLMPPQGFCFFSSVDVIVAEC
jgi:hypothetical protein